MICKICKEPIRKGQRYFRGPSGRCRHRECGTETVTNWKDMARDAIDALSTLNLQILDDCMELDQIIKETNAKGKFHESAKAKSVKAMLIVISNRIDRMRIDRNLNCIPK